MLSPPRRVGAARHARRLAGDRRPIDVLCWRIFTRRFGGDGFVRVVPSVRVILCRLLLRIGFARWTRPLKDKVRYYFGGPEASDRISVIEVYMA